MKVVQINAYNKIGSTGTICLKISSILDNKNIENYILFARGEKSKSTSICFPFLPFPNIYYKVSALFSRIIGNYGLESILTTLQIVKQLKKIKPSIVHLHNIHDHFININILFKYLKKQDIKIIWTFHDCWAFTGYCSYFTMNHCNKWTTECNRCPQYKQFSWFFDQSNRLFNEKKKLFSNLNLTIVTPSQWLADLVKQSVFFKKYPCIVINNGIDLSIFKPTISDFRRKYKMDNKYVLLGVAFDWGKRKGLDVFVELAQTMGPNYQIILVGTNNCIDKQLPNNIISIHRTSNQEELAEIYTVADVFINPTREEVLGMVNIEANACGTPVLTFNTGGSPECIDKTSGVVVECDDVDAMEKEIIKICETHPFSSESCRKKAKQFDMNEKFNEYVQLYETVDNS